MSDDVAIADLIPHAGSMCLLERILEWDDEGVRLATKTHLSPENPLRRGGSLDAVHLCEYGAQAMAVHGGLLARRDGGRANPGFLVSLRDVWLTAGSIESFTDELVVVARRQHGDAAGWQYAFEVESGGRRLASGRATIAMRR